MQKDSFGVSVAATVSATATAWQCALLVPYWDKTVLEFTRIPCSCYVLKQCRQLLLATDAFFSFFGDRKFYGAVDTEGTTGDSESRCVSEPARVMAVRRRSF